MWAISSPTDARAGEDLNCGYQALPDFPNQEVVSGPIIELRDVFDLVERYKANKLILNIETKVEAGAPTETAPRELFVRRVWEEIRDAGMSDQVTSSRSTGAPDDDAHARARSPLVALTNLDFLQVGQRVLAVAGRHRRRRLRRRLRRRGGVDRRSRPPCRRPGLPAKRHDRRPRLRSVSRREDDRGRPQPRPRR